MGNGITLNCELNFTRRWLKEQIITACKANSATCDERLIEVKRSQSEKEVRERGEFASNAPLVLSRILQVAPGDCAALLKAHLTHWPGTIDEAKGFLNFRMDQSATKSIVAHAAQQGARFGVGNSLAGQRINVEFVSSEPNSLLTLTSARHAICGEALCRLFEFQGADVTREFFLNDVQTSSKLRLLGESVGAFYEAHFHSVENLPEGILQDDFVRGVARDLATRDGNRHLLEPEAERNLFFSQEAAGAAIRAQKEELQKLGVRFDLWVSETNLHDDSIVHGAIEKLRQTGHVYERDGALWLATSQFGDEADHPLVRNNGQPTYLASDIAYHSWKFNRAFDVVLNIWSGEHRPYVARTHAALKAFGCDVNKLEIIVCEGARLRLDGETMTGRDEAPLIWQDAQSEVEAENLRLHLLLADWDKVAAIDVEVASRDDEGNPAYAARLAPSRLATMIRQVEARNSSQNSESSAEFSSEEAEVARLVALWPDTVENAALQRAPQRVARWTIEFSEAVRRLLSASQAGEASAQRLELLQGAQNAVQSALHLLGIEVKEQF
ncbi:MAG TPA: arginine--tRNA ligase [Abditibacteriaceae bacterium]